MLQNDSQCTKKNGNTFYSNIQLNDKKCETKHKGIQHIKKTPLGVTTFSLSLKKSTPSVTTFSKTTLYTVLISVIMLRVNVPFFHSTLIGAVVRADMAAVACVFFEEKSQVLTILKWKINVTSSRFRCDYSQYAPQLIRAFILLFTSKDEVILQQAWNALAAVTKNMDADEQVSKENIEVV
jgi:hypothetical protein